MADKSDGKKIRKMDTNNGEPSSNPNTNPSTNPSTNQDKENLSPNVDENKDTELEGRRNLDASIQIEKKQDEDNTEIDLPTDNKNDPNTSMDSDLGLDEKAIATLLNDSQDSQETVKELSENMKTLTTKEREEMEQGLSEGETAIKTRSRSVTSHTTKPRPDYAAIAAGKAKTDNPKKDEHRLENKEEPKTDKKGKTKSKDKKKKKILPDDSERIEELKKLVKTKEDQVKDKEETIQELKEEIEEYKEKIEDLEDEIKKTDTQTEEIEYLKRVIADQEEGRKEQERKIQELYKKIENLKEEGGERAKEEYEKLKRKYESEVTEYDKEIAEKEREIDEYKEENDNLMRANDTYKEYAEELKQRNQAQEERIGSLTERIERKKQREGRETQAQKRSRADQKPDSLDNYGKKQKLSTETPEPTSAPTHRQETRSSTPNETTKHRQETRTPNETIKPSTSNKHIEEVRDREQKRTEKTWERKAEIIIVIENNSDRIVRHLKLMSKERNYTVIRSPSSLDDLDYIMSEKNVQNNITKADQLIIQAGLRDIKRGEEGTEVAEKLVKIAKEIGRDTLTQVRLCEIPQIDDTEKIRREIDRFNYHIRDNIRYAFRMTKIRKATARETLEENGTTLTDIGAELVAKDIEAQAIPAAVVSGTKKIIEDYSQGIIARVIGREGRNRYDLETRHKVQLIARNKTIIIRGPEEGVRKAKQEVDNIADSYERTEYYSREDNTRYRRRSESPV